MSVAFRDLVRGASLRGGPTASLDGEAAEKLGRAFGTQLRRRSLPLTVLMARSAPASPVRDGFVRGLVLSGCHVVDFGCRSSEELTSLVRARSGSSAVFVGAVSLQPMVLLFAGGRPLVGDALLEIADLAQAGAFTVGVGGLVLEDPTAELVGIEARF